jgi:hypothetical protein
LGTNGQPFAKAKPNSRQFQSYFHIFPWNELPPNPVGIDVGCGSARWSVMVAKDSPSPSARCKRGRPDRRAVEFSLGVLHHVPDTALASRAIATNRKFYLMRTDDYEPIILHEA